MRVAAGRSVLLGCRVLSADNPCFFDMGIKNGKFVAPNGDKPSCVPKRLATKA